MKGIACHPRRVVNQLVGPYRACDTPRGSAPTFGVLGPPPHTALEGPASHGATQDGPPLSPAPKYRRTTLLAVVAGGVAVGLLAAAAILVYAGADSGLRSQATARVRASAALAAQLVGEQTLRFSEL